MKFWIVKSEIDFNVYFVFREDGEEIRVEIVNGLLRPSKKLTAPESNYIVKYFVKTINKTELNKIIQHHLDYGTDKEISKTLNIPLGIVSRSIREYWDNKKVG